MQNKNHNDEDKLVARLNFLSVDEKTLWWTDNQNGCSYKSSEKEDEIEFNWYYFTNQNIWMCRVYDYNQAKEGKGFLKDVLYFKEKENLNKIYKQWIAS